MPATIAAAKAGATTGEWAETLREAFGAYRGPTGVGGAAAAGRRASCSPRSAQRVDEVSERIGHRIKILVGKPGLDGHSNGAEQIALRARDVGMEVDLPGHPPDPGARSPSLGAAGGRRRGRPLDPLRLPPGAGPRGRARCCARRASTCPVVVGGIIPAADAERLRAGGRRRRLHAEGLRPQPDHGRDRRAGRASAPAPARRAPPERPARRLQGAEARDGARQWT